MPPLTVLLDAILALVVLEAIVLAALGRRHLLANLAAGGALLLATRLALSPATPLPVLACIAVAGLAHVADLRQRLSKSQVSRPS